MVERSRGLTVGAFEFVRHGMAGAAALALARLGATTVTVYLGDSADVRAASIAALAVGLATGAVTPHSPRVWLRSAAVGALAVAATLVVPLATFLGVRGALPTSIPARMIVTVVLAFVIAFTVGLSISAAGDRNGHRAAWFTGGALGVVAAAWGIERELGLEGALLAVAILALLPAVRHGPPPIPRAGDSLLPGPARARAYELGAGTCLGVFLEAARPVARDVLGPAAENGVALTSGVALAFAAAFVLGPRLPIARARLFFFAALASALATLVAPDLFAACARAWSRTDDPTTRGLLRLAFLVVLVGPTVFALVTATVASGRTPRVIAHLALGCALGLLGTRFTVQSRVPLAVLFGAVSVASAFVGFLATARFRRIDAGALLALSSLLVVAVVRFPEMALTAGQFDTGRLPSPDSVVVRITRMRAAGEELDVLRDSHGTERVRGDGKDDVVVSGGRADARELMTGVVPSVYTERRRRAFVFGSSGGVAAGAVSKLFAHTDVVDASPAARDVLAHFSSVNFDVARSPTATVHGGEDPFVALAASSGDYDLILSAAPSLRDVAVAKIVTRELLTLARARLAPGGVVALGIDDGLPIAALAIFLRTVSDAFAECHFAFLEPERYVVVCGDHLVGRGARLPPELQTAVERTTQELGVDRFIEAMVLVPRHFHGDWFPVPNTFDLPVLTHVMAREDNRAAAWDLDLAVRFDLSTPAFGGPTFEGPAVFDRCFALGVIGGGRPLPRCTTYLRAASGRPLALQSIGPNAFPLPASVLARSASSWRRDVRGLVSGATLLAELLYAGEEATARELVMARAEQKTLTGPEASFAKRRHLID